MCSSAGAAIRNGLGVVINFGLSGALYLTLSLLKGPLGIIVGREWQYMCHGPKRGIRVSGRVGFDVSALVQCRLYMYGADGSCLGLSLFHEWLVVLPVYSCR